MKLLLADDHNLFREALVHYIERSEPNSTVLLARDVHEAMELMEGDPELDLILLDLHMPGMNGLQGLEKFRQNYPHVPVAMISGLAEKKDVEEALAKGAIGYFPKTLSGKALIQGIKKILEGDSYVARNHNTDDVMVSYHNDGEKRGGYNGIGGEEHLESVATDFSLTPREKEVLEFLLRGASNKEIARALDLQVVTVKLHVRGVCRKLDAKNRTQAALIAQGQGM